MKEHTALPQTIAGFGGENEGKGRIG